MFTIDIIPVGVTDQRAHTNIYVGPRAQFKEEPLLSHRKNPSSARYSRGQREQSTIESDTPGHSME